MLTAVDAATDPSITATGVSDEAAEHYRAVGAWIGDTHTAMLARSVSRFAHRPAATDRDRSVTYAELDQGAAAAAQWLKDAGVGRGEAVIVQLPNCIAYLEAIFGIWRIGAIPVFTLPAHGARDIIHFHRQAPARFHLGPTKGDRHHRRVLAQLAEKAPELTLLDVDVRSAHPFGTTENDPEPIEVPPSELAFLQLSGGTTGAPKLIPKTHDDYLYSVRQSLTLCDLQGDSIVLVALPAAHNFTMSSPGILGALMVGAHLVFAPDPSPTTLAPLIDRHRITHAAFVPPVLLGLLNYPERDRFDLSSLETIWVGGAKLSENVARRIRPELGCRLQQVFGMAEGLVNYTRLDDPEDTIITTQGRPMSPFDEIRVVDTEGSPVPPGKPGELLTRGPYTIRRYHRNPEANDRSFTAEGFYRTGDLVVQAADGSITVVGRVKDQINRGGEKIAPEAVENALLSHPEIHDVSVVGIPDDVWGERTCAYVIPRAGTENTSLTSTVVKRYARSRGLASFAVPDTVELCDEFPLTGVGKVSKKDQR
ncbi:2,3-dihydroxybenzoate-AMP ligase [Corynebacterium yudongzhengii]|uniref:(2,3-dihydroxybenzoyl)adenylate synthase n=1 Tax=Corynebacterium yudongzhengii TaxID=2080740 RepID=A0A2U1T9V9_9CORY|nr:AMP-binding protein [Corynebacterium yudongzhengii]AWB81242.1 2,3-dihydroxybenzoate-AMP ligase [Corynebacterium yudongzhengii]PWC02781.1 (2,3-dihydroxybenzoyl)adenylate synthase [Corynebacterium yudongzhengii]